MYNGGSKIVDGIRNADTDLIIEGSLEALTGLAGYAAGVYTFVDATEQIIWKGKPSSSVANYAEMDLNDEAPGSNGKGSKTTEDIYSFGNKSEPRDARPKQDFGVDDFNDVVGYNGEKFPKGASNVNDVNNAPLSGHYHQLPAGTQLPDGLGIKPDGCDIFPDSPHGPGHSTIYPTKPMTVEEFNSLYKSLPWTYGGKK